MQLKTRYRVVTRWPIGLAATVAFTIASSAAIGQPDAPQPAAAAAPTGNPLPSPSARTGSTPPSPYSPAAPDYPPGYGAPAPGAPAPHPYPGYSPYYSPGYAYPSYPPPSTPPTQAIEEPRPRGWHTHDGFFLRFQLGPGTSLISTGRSSLLVGGLAEYIALGWALSPRVVLFAEMGGVMGFLSDSDEGSLLAVGTYTLRASYYLQNNLFVGGGIGLGVMAFGGTENDKGGARKSKMGLGLRFEFGQEYWVSTNWALGWVLSLAFATAPDKDVSGINWTGIAFSPAFSISYN